MKGVDMPFNGTAWLRAVTRENIKTLNYPLSKIGSLYQRNSNTCIISHFKNPLPALYCAQSKCFSMHAGALGGIVHGFSLVILVSSAPFSRTYTNERINTLQELQMFVVDH